MPAPEPDEIEVTVLGPGVGESICVHVTNGDWIIVDSCRDPETDDPAPLTYLKSIGVDVERAVKLVICTHCDQDHTFGLDQIVREAKSASVSIPLAFTERAFSDLVKLSDAKLGDSSQLKHFGAVLEVLSATGRAVTRTQANQTLTFGSTCEVMALSPSTHEVQFSLQWIAAQMVEAQSRRQVRCPSPNETSVATHIKLGEHEIVLGADVELGTSANCGWEGILQTFSQRIGRVGIFKVSHHGSSNGHSAQFWSQHLHNNAIGILTAYARGHAQQQLPSQRDIQRICAANPKSYATSLPKSSAFKDKYGREAERIANSKHVTVKRVLNKSVGRVSVRWKVTTPIDQASVSLDGPATSICSFSAEMNSSRVH